MSTNRPNASIWDDDEGEAQLRPMMRKNNAHLFDDEPPVSSLSAASAASAAAAVAGYTASSAAEANAASALSAPSAYSVGSASSALSARSAGSAYSAASASSAAVPSAASAAAPEAADAAVSAPTPDSAGSAPLSTRSGATPDAAPSAASAPAMPPSQTPKSAPSAPVNGPVLGTTPSVHVPASSLANNGVPAMLANTPPATGRRYTNAENAHTSGTFDSAARRATATTAATSATASTGASALTAASAAAASVTAQSPASATSANAPELADAAKPAVADAGAANPGAVRRRSLFTAVPQPVPIDEDSDDETIQVPVVREDLIPDSFSAASAVSASAASASAASASATSAAESASAAETVSAAETTSAAETSSSVSAASAPSSLEHSSAATSPASASDDVAPAPAATPAPAVTVPTPESTVQADQEAVDSVQELNDAYEVEAAAVPLPTDFDAPSAISIPTPPHTVSSALSAESTFSIDSAVSAASAASSVGITLPSAATPAPAVPVTPVPAVPVTLAAGATDTASNELSKTTPTADAPEPPAPPAPEQPEATKADFADDEVVASDHTETTIMDAADMELEEVVKPVVTSTSPVGVERLDHLATADSADLAPVAPSPSSAIFASTRTAAFSDSANQSDADNEVDDDVLLAGSTVVGKPASRAAAHWGGTLLALVLFPIAWFLMHTAANALTGALADGWPKVFSTAGIIELGMAIVLLIVVMATATRSSLGTFVTGITTLLIGLPFVVVPSITKQYLGDFLANMALQSRFGRILSEAILLDGVSGRLVIIGLFLIMLGVVSHSTRRAGRRERLVMDRANTKK